MSRFLAAIIALTLGASLHAESLTDRQAAYIKAGRAVVDMVNAKAIDAEKVAALVLTMQQQAVPLANAYSAKFPPGKGIIDTVIAQVATVDGSGQVTGLGPMKDMAFEVIEKQWHDLGHFKTNKPAIDLTDEDNEHYSDPLHTMIHPMMVLRAAMDYKTSKSDKDLQAMKEEMEEGLEQVEKTVGVLTK
jgi:hypothetical protein